jgi:wyosine [tRNA(Phe)-imidazoG37] synthetase (radical SAM superfamily)
VSHVFGPVPSRRLGHSLGVDPIPFKTCNYSCVYCQLGRTTRMTNARRDFYPPEEILAQLAEALAVHAGDLDWVTITGEGEPTLYRSLGDLVHGIRDLTDLPLAVITNGSLLDRADVRRDLYAVDLVMPSLDAADPETFRRIDRPHGHLEIENVIRGIADFRNAFDGEMWLEIMLCRGLNDGEEQLLALRRAIDRIAPDRVWINTPVRPPAEGRVQVPDEATLARAREILGEGIEPDPTPRSFIAAEFDDPGGHLLEVLRRHPMREDQIPRAFPSLPREEIALLVANLRETGRVREIRRGDDVYLTPAEGAYIDPR